MRIDPAPTPEEAAAIVAALEVLRSGERSSREEEPRQSRWELAGRLGRPLPRGKRPDGSLWALAAWEEKA